MKVIAPRPRPEMMIGTTTRKRTSCGDLYLTVNQDEKGLPFEAFATMGKAGGCEGSFNEAIGRLISLCLRAGVTPRDIVKQLIGIRCDKPFGLGKEKVLSCSDAVAKIFNQAFENKVPEKRYPDPIAQVAQAAVIEEEIVQEKKIAFPAPIAGASWNSRKGARSAISAAIRDVIKNSELVFSPGLRVCLRRSIQFTLLARRFVKCNIQVNNRF